MTDATATGSGVVVVGVDGSEPSRRALRFAAEDARRRGARLRVIAAYDTASDAFMVGYGAPQVWMDSRHDSVQKMADELVAEVVGEKGPDLDVTVEVRPGPAAAGLVTRSADADLLVVGSRGLGGFRGLVLGSVSQQCVLHARCPVTVVHGDPHPSAAEPAAEPA
jgi:nucleotide-binding universal stress UspA family protein